MVYLILSKMHKRIRRLASLSKDLMLEQNKKAVNRRWKHAWGTKEGFRSITQACRNKGISRTTKTSTEQRKYRSGVLKAFFALVFTNSLVDPERLKEKKN